MPKTGKRLKKVVKSISRLRRLTLQKPDVLHTYLRHSEVNQYLDYIGHRYSNFVKIHNLGTSYECRQMKAIEIDWGMDKNMLAQPREAKLMTRRQLWAATIIENKMQMEKTPDSLQYLQKPADIVLRNVCFIEGGTHAREWISVSVALNCIYQLTEKNIRNREVLRKLRFFIVPLVNPDGYEYTRLKNRKWRKNRRPSSLSKTIGTDCNRNYDIHWENGPSKANRNTYKGDKPFSEPETCALRNVLQRLGNQLLVVLSLHSYAQSIMYPFGYSKDLPPTWPKLHLLATIGRDAIKAYSGRFYRIGSIASLTKRTIPGSIVDYAFGVINVPVAMVIELPSSDYGFQPPLEVISPIGHESWFGVRAICKNAYDMFRETLFDAIKPTSPQTNDVTIPNSTANEISTIVNNSAVPTPVPKKSIKGRSRKRRRNNLARVVNNLFAGISTTTPVYKAQSPETQISAESPEKTDDDNSTPEKTDDDNSTPSTEI